MAATVLVQLQTAARNRALRTEYVRLYHALTAGTLVPVRLRAAARRTVEDQLADQFTLSRERVRQIVGGAP